MVERETTSNVIITMIPRGNLKHLAGRYLSRKSHIFVHSVGWDKPQLDQTLTGMGGDGRNCETLGDISKGTPL